MRWPSPNVAAEWWAPSGADTVQAAIAAWKAGAGLRPFIDSLL